MSVATRYASSLPLGPIRIVCVCCHVHSRVGFKWARRREQWCNVMLVLRGCTPTL
jgi:hypothetical protein